MINLYIEVSIEAYHLDSYDDVLDDELMLIERHITEILTEMMSHIDLDKE